MIIAMMLPGLAKIGILVDYKINQDFIAEVLCINKEEPMSTCYGKCYLEQQFEKTEDQEEKQAPSDKKEQLEVPYCYSRTSYHFLSVSDHYRGKLSFDYVTEFYKSSFMADIFRPPKFNLI